MKSILLFAALLITIVLRSQTTLTIGEIFDFDINDEIQSFNDKPAEPPNAIRMTIIGKHFSATNDTVYYTRSFDNYYTVFNPDPTPHLDYIFNSYIDTVFYTNLNDSVLCNTSDTSCNSIIDTTICGVTTNGWEYIGLEEYTSTIYGKGLGIVRHVYWQDPTLFYDYKIFYFKKDTMECGTPDLTTSINSNRTSQDVVNVYPNPFTDKFNIRFTDDRQTYNIKIFDLKGLKVFETTAKHQNNIIVDKINDKGFYIIKIESENNSYIREIIKK